MRGNTIHAVFNDATVCQTSPLYQYDYGQKLVFDDIELPESFTVYFSNGVAKDAKAAVGTPEGV